MANPTWDVRVDWNNDGDYSDTGEDITSDVLARSQMSVDYGRDQARSLAPMASGQAALDVRNDSGDYSPENSSSPLAGLLGPGRPLRIQATHSAVTYSVYHGYLDDYDVRAAVDDQFVTFTALDGLARLKGVEVSTALYPSLQTGAAIDHILDAVGWTAGRDIDTGATTMRWWWEETADAFQAVERILHSEGPTALAYIGPDGEFVFRDRHHRLTRSASTSVQATFSGSSEPQISQDLGYEVGWRDIVNSVEFNVEEREPGDIEMVWSDTTIYTIVPGETKTFDVVTDHPITSLQTPTQGTTTSSDFMVVTGSTLTVSFNRTSGRSLRMSVSVPLAGISTTVLQMQLRAAYVQVARTIKVKAEDSASIAQYGRRPYRLDAPWLTRNEAGPIADLIIGMRAQRLPVITMKLHGANDTRLAQQLGRDLSDRVQVIAAALGMDAEFFIEHISHKLIEGGLLETAFGCEKAPSIPTTVFRFNVAGRGFNDGEFGPSGLDDPATIFQFDTSGHGFDDGLLAT